MPAAPAAGQPAVARARGLLAGVRRGSSRAGQQAQITGSQSDQLPPFVCCSLHSKESDVFSFGVVLWELLTWDVPWYSQDGRSSGAPANVFAVRCRCCGRACRWVGARACCAPGLAPAQAPGWPLSPAPARRPSCWPSPLAHAHNPVPRPAPQLGNLVRSGERPPLPEDLSLLRGYPGPALRAGLEAYVLLMQRCWASEPCERPSFEEVIEVGGAGLVGWAWRAGPGGLALVGWAWWAGAGGLALAGWRWWAGAGGLVLVGWRWHCSVQEPLQLQASLGCNHLSPLPPCSTPAPPNPPPCRRWMRSRRRPRPRGPAAAGAMWRSLRLPQPRWQPAPAAGPPPLWLTY
jgi:hypothetical protein